MATHNHAVVPINFFFFFFWGGGGGEGVCVCQLPLIDMPSNMHGGTRFWEHVLPIEAAVQNVQCM